MKGQCRLGELDRRAHQVVAVRRGQRHAGGRDGDRTERSEGMPVAPRAAQDVISHGDAVPPLLLASARPVDGAEPVAAVDGYEVHRRAPPRPEREPPRTVVALPAIVSVTSTAILYRSRRG